MVLKKTSEKGFVFPRSVNPTGAFLADFDIDGSALKKDHRDWLDEEIIGPAKAKGHTPGGWSIDLIGRASQSGSDQHNIWLSDQRARAVQSYLGPRLAGLPVIYHVSQLGESSPYQVNEYEHELDRSVEVLARFISVKPPKKPKIRILIPKVHPWRPRPNRKVMDFKLQVLAAEIIIYTLSVKFPGINVGQGDARVKMLINIRELGSTDHALFELLGKGRGMIVDAKPSFKKFIPGLTYGNWSAKYGKGNEHSFATDVEMDAADFAGPAFFNFDLLNRTLSFGPTKGFFGSQKKIRNLSFGPTADANILKYAEASCFCEMNIVDSAPVWAH